MLRKLLPLAALLAAAPLAAQHCQADFTRAPVKLWADRAWLRATIAAPNGLDSVTRLYPVHSLSNTAQSVGLVMPAPIWLDTFVAKAPAGSQVRLLYKTSLRKGECLVWATTDSFVVASVRQDPASKQRGYAVVGDSVLRVGRITVKAWRGVVVP